MLRKETPAVEAQPKTVRHTPTSAREKHCLAKSSVQKSGCAQERRKPNRDVVTTTL